MRNIGRSGLLFGLIVCLCCCVEVESVSCSNGAGYCDDYTSYITCNVNNSDTQLIKELLRDCSNRSTNFRTLYVYKNYVSKGYGHLHIDIELPSNIQSLYIRNFRDQNHIRITTFNINTALTYMYLYIHGELESKDLEYFTSLRQLYIRQLLSKESTSFKKLESLTSLSVSLKRTISHTLDDTFVSGLTNLFFLGLGSSSFNGITKGAFRNLTGLYSLYIRDNKITNIEDGVFTDCTNLRRLYLDGNGLNNISNNAFEGLSNLQYLHAYGNPGFPISVLLETRNLRWIDLRYNEYQTLDPYVLHQMKYLNAIYLEDPFICDCNLQWISVIQQYGIDIRTYPYCIQPSLHNERYIYDSIVYTNCSQSQTYQCFNKSITCPSNLVCHNTNDSYTCDCPIGYALNNSGNCTDINECDNETNCQQSCMNTEGSYSCNCDKGYQLASNGYDCDDVNECLEGNGGCEHGCGNTVGSYQCYCQHGHQLYNQTHCERNIECDVIDNGYSQNNSFVCQGGFNITITNFTCDYHEPTTNPATSASDCPIGYSQRSTGECNDEDECDQDTKCEHSCMNTQGSFFCMCHEGYQLASNQQNCSDVNECQEWNGGCEYGCGNTIGSYHCFCENGHSLKNETHCETNIECDVIDNGDDQDNIYVCNGGFNITITNLTCDHNVHPTTETIPVTPATGCPIGYVQRNTGECVDENECDQDTKCQYSCANTEGSFFCTCPEGYELASNQYNCSDVNECQEWNGGCEYGCGNTIGSYHCFCENGHSLKNETHCETNIKCDIIENGSSNDNVFICQGGFNITVTNLTCDNSAHPTTETIPVTPATGCPIGYVQRSTGECVDENECDQDTKCQHSCANTERSFFCTCPEGYELASNQYNCSDVNECQEWNGGCEYGCGNTIGSYHCFCENGHSLKNETHCETNIECDVIDNGDDQDNIYVCNGGFNHNQISLVITSEICDCDIESSVTDIDIILIISIVNYVTMSHNEFRSLMNDHFSQKQ